ncbi:11034_t:CDS:2, partial [Entrophospora sp. SA101]
MGFPNFDPPRGVFTLPIPCDAANIFWEDVKVAEHFILQKTKASSNIFFRGVIGTIQNVLDTKQPPFRIIFRSDPLGITLQIAVSETTKGIEDAWKWLEDSLSSELLKLDNPGEKENYVVTKINSLVTRQYKGTDEVSEDESVRSASRAFHQTFDISPNERLVNCEQFKKIAEYLINDVILYLPKNKKYQIIELEFYFNTLENNSNDNALLHCDPYSHQHEHQKTSGEWYFHRVGKFGYRGGTRKGIDITFGNENAYGGILIRSIKRIIDNEDDDENELIEGPSLIVDEILRLCGVDNLSIKEMVEVKWKGKSGICKDFKNFNGMIWLEEMKYTKNVDDSDGDGNNDDGGDDDGGRSEEKIRNFNKRAKYSTGVSSPYFIKSSSQSSMKHKRKSNNLKHKEIVYNSPRVGLTLSNTNPSPNLRLNFLLKPYRFFIKPHLIKKGKAQLIIGLYDRYQDINK